MLSVIYIILASLLAHLADKGFFSGVWPTSETTVVLVVPTARRKVRTRTLRSSGMKTKRAFRARKFHGRFNRAFMQYRETVRTTASPVVTKTKQLSLKEARHAEFRLRLRKGRAAAEKAQTMASGPQLEISSRVMALGVVNFLLDCAVAAEVARRATQKRRQAIAAYRRKQVAQATEALDLCLKAEAARKAAEAKVSLLLEQEKKNWALGAQYRANKAAALAAKKFLVAGGYEAMALQRQENLKTQAAILSLDFKEASSRRLFAAYVAKNGRFDSKTFNNAMLTNSSLAIFICVPRWNAKKSEVNS